MKYRLENIRNGIYHDYDECYLKQIIILKIEM